MQHNTMLREAQILDRQVKEAYRRGHTDGVAHGLKMAMLLFRENHDQTYIQMQESINKAILNLGE